MSTRFNIDDTFPMEDDDLIFALYRPLQDSQWLDPSSIQSSQYDDFSHAIHDGVQMSNDFSAAIRTQTDGGHTNSLPPYMNQAYVPPNRSIGVPAETLRSYIYPPAELSNPPSANPYPPHHADFMLDPNSGPTPGHYTAQMVPEEETGLDEELLRLGLQVTWEYERDRRLKQLSTGTTIPRDLALPWLHFSVPRGVILGLEPGETRLKDEDGKCTYCAKDIERPIMHFLSHVVDDIYREHTPVGQGRMGILSTPQRINEAFDWFETRCDELRCMPCSKGFITPCATKLHAKVNHGIEGSKSNSGGKGSFHGAASKLLERLGFHVRVQGRRQRQT